MTDQDYEVTADDIASWQIELRKKRFQHRQLGKEIRALLRKVDAAETLWPDLFDDDGNVIVPPK